MKANQRMRDDAGAETVGALILFGLFVTVIALLNVTAVPAAGLAAEEEHLAKVLDALNGLQSEAEAGALPGNEGATVARAFPLAPERDVGQDFFSHFMAQPARATGEITFADDYGNITLTHTKADAERSVDIGSLDARFPTGRLTFDPHPIFRGAGVVALENGGIVTTAASTETMRFAPPVTVSVSGGTTHVAVKARVLNGTALSVGGTSGLRLGLLTEAATLRAPQANNAAEATLRLETMHGSAWGAYLNQTSTAGGLEAGAGFSMSVARGAGEGGLDVVTWTVTGTGAGNDLRLTYGLAVHTLTVS